MTDGNGEPPGGDWDPDDPGGDPPRRPPSFAGSGPAPGPRPGYYPLTGPPPGPGEPSVPEPLAEPTAATVPGRTAGRGRHTGARRRSGPAPAQQQLMARISAGRKARQQRAVLVVCCLLSALVLLASGTAWAITTWVSGSVGRLNVGTGGTPSSGPLNILVAGVDVRAGLTSQQQAELHVGHDVSSNSDTLMVVHVTADHRSVQVIALPRDSWVNIPGHGMSKINAAFGLGGPKLMVSTVEANTGLTINDFIEVNFLGFVKIIDALGGVDICLPYAVDDSYSGLHLAAGMHHVSGITALEFARDRHSFAASDLARIKDQQQLMSSLFKEAISSGTVTDPLKLTSFLSAAAAAVKVDQGLNVIKLADELRGISMHDVTFTTVPIANAGYMTSTGESAVLWDSTAATALFDSLKNDKAASKPRASRSRLSRGQVSVDVYNGTFIGGLSANTGAKLGSLGFRVHGAGLTWPKQDLSQTLIEYPAGQKAAARLVHRVMPGATLRQVSKLARIRILLGTSGYQVSAGTPAASNPNAASTKPTTAAQAACR
jgi:LCP family protein required for cell wall assembly